MDKASCIECGDPMATDNTWSDNQATWIDSRGNPHTLMLSGRTFHCYACSVKLIYFPVSPSDILLWSKEENQEL